MFGNNNTSAATQLQQIQPLVTYSA